MTARIVPRFVAGGLVALALMSQAARAGEVDVVGVEVEQTATGVYAFHVTLRHEDEGWEHYTDRWDVVAPDGTVLASRVLAHPHVNEQPFTRSLSGIAIDVGINEVLIRGHDSVHGEGGDTLLVTLP
jgi:hypothetical protein